jgi:hypothetical protein
VILEIRARPTQGRLLGNLLAGVAGLLDNGLGLRLGQLIEDLPIQDIVTNVIRGFVQQLFDSIQNGAENGAETGGE